jgi:aldose 1-epimerase
MDYANVEITHFGEMPNGKKSYLYTLTNANGMCVKISDFGATIVSIYVPDKNGYFEDITHGCNTLEGYLKGVPYFGATIGRYGNRIANGEFSLEGCSYFLEKNNGNNTLHGGTKGFDKVIWEAKITKGETSSLILTNKSPNGDQGFPGHLVVEASFTLTNDNALMFSYKATTDKTTVLNITNHSYFNLSGEGNILEHQLKLNADKYLPVNNNMIPTGHIASVKNTPFDFTEFQRIGDRINDTSDEQLLLGEGYDHCFVLNEHDNKLKMAATVYESRSGRMMDVFTTEPGLQLYTANHLDGSIIGKKGETYSYRSAFCLEAQHFPDSPNQPGFPSTILRPNETFQSSTVLRFSIKK